MKLLFTGDINFRGLTDLTIKSSEQILADVLPYAAKADHVIPNLECPLADKQKYAPILKSGPALICVPENICFLKAFRAEAVTLANNHIGDYGDGALRDTLSLLEEHGIAHAGAGENLDEAYRAVTFSDGSMTVSILSVCEHEFGVATETTPGSAVYMARRLLAKIREEKEKSDRVVVVFHGGNEFDPLPSPDTVERYRLICDMGADAVIGGHTHCPQGYELYDGKPIVYSMGNLLFQSGSPRDARDSWHYGYMTLLELTESGSSFEVIPYKFAPDASKITVFEGAERNAMLEYIKNLSSIIADPDALKRHFCGWAYLHPWCPSLPTDLKHPKNYDNAAGNLNLVLCEAHSNLLPAILECLFENKIEMAAEMAEEIQKLQHMPV